MRKELAGDRHLLRGDGPHADDTSIRVLDRSLRDRGLGKGVKKGRIWAYVRIAALGRTASYRRNANCRTEQQYLRRLKNGRPTQKRCWMAWSMCGHFSARMVGLSCLRGWTSPAGFLDC
ncbi:hypothetical protein DPM13_15030 [Paracoccus mutanolyticus]|uniref:Transposase n=1 Tax=Paracoccus mutanolyticus TaxID=1499308 RepID=A0ABN5M7I7_9RHOB|nr:hypothetical protein DPM13_15030 [Paracoccus mutanolyticus]